MNYLSRRTFLGTLGGAAATWLGRDIFLSAAPVESGAAAASLPLAPWSLSWARDQVAACPIHYTAEHGPTRLEVWLLPTDSDVRLFWQPTRLDGPYPGGNLSLHRTRLIVEGPEKREIGLLPSSVFGAGTKRERVDMMPQLPFAMRIGLKKGRYHLSVEFDLQGPDNPKDSTVRCELGALTLEKDLLAPKRCLLNEWFYRMPDRQAVAGSTVPSSGCIEVSGTNPVSMFGKYVDLAAKDVWEYGCCPFQTSYLPNNRIPARGGRYNDRAFGFYLTAAAAAYRLSGAANHYHHALTCYLTNTQNLWKAPWGGLTSGAYLFRQTDNILRHSILIEGCYRFYEITQDKELLRPWYHLLRHWPRDEKQSIPLRVIDARGRRTAPYGDPYNMMAGGLWAYYALGDLFDDEEMKSFATKGVREYVLPGVKDGGWPYQPGMKYSKHYDLRVKKYLGFLLRYPEWRDDKVFRRCLTYGADVAMERCASEENGRLVWDDSYHEFIGHPKYHINLALGKAGYMAHLGRELVLVGEERYLEPLRKTVRFIQSIHDSGQVGDFWRASWMQQTVVAPVLQLAVDTKEL